MKITSLASTLLLLCSSSSVMAHFILDYPISRGFDDDAEPNAPCGGFNAVPTNRSMFPLSGGFIDINSFHVSSTVTINIALGNNPSAANFTAAAATPASSPTSISINHPGHSCLSLNLTSFTGAVNNTNATIQVIYNGGDGELYQCADVVLVANATTFNMTQCITDNGASATPTSGSGSTSSAANMVGVNVQGLVVGIAGILGVAVAMVL
ncbi:hypothetical protein BGZ58_010195 [Dissophora ornata]|nr:hypothetical protein BGZ58_010195 [Dissophora ornata]